jgi:photosystem II stability/assembly factor-like uncharacterized protein
MKRTLVALACIVALLACMLAAQRHDSWRVVGPGGGGSTFHPTLSPLAPNTALVASDMTGAYITHDGGRSWRMLNLGGTVHFFAFDPHDPSVIYAQAQALFRSADAGESWSMILPRPQSVRGMSLADDHAEVTFQVSSGPRGPATALAIDPADSRVLYAALGSGPQAALWTSSDAGATWQESGALPAGASQIWVDGHSPAANRTLYVATSQAIVVRRDGRWQTGASPGPLEHVSAGFPALGPPVVYATSRGRILVSEDGGGQWRESLLPGTGGQAGEISTSAHHPETAYVAFQGLRTPLRSSYGVAKTIDRGLHWQLVWQDARTLAANVHDAWLSERFGPGWPGVPYGIGVSPNDPAVVLTTDSGRVMRTGDGGATWEAVYSKPAPGGWTTTGLDVTTCYGVHFDPFDARRLFISYTDIGLFASEDGGQSWQSATRAGVPGGWVNTTYWMEFDPRVRGRVWAAMSAVHDLPRDKMWRGRSPDTYTGGVVASVDGGRTWHAANAGMGETAATHILLDPASPPEARVLYVAGFGRGVFQSIDGGEHWSLRNTGIAGAQPFAWRLARDSEGTLYLVVARRDEQSPGALYRSADAAAHWTPVPLPPGVTGPNGLAIDPRNPRRLWLAAWGRATREGAKDGGIYFSQDAGATWRNVLPADQHIYDVTIDSRDPRLLYATGFESSAWRSTDSGATWRRLRGFNFKWGHRVIPDQRDPSKVYIATFGGSVWHGPAAGDPQAPEDLLDRLLAFVPH